MAGFIYYRPGASKIVTREDVESWGLGYAFSSASVSGTVCNNNTPDSGMGVVFGDRSRLGDWQPVMEMENQVWRKMADSECYIGYWKESPPTPDDLLRPAFFDGYEVKLGPHTWSVPLTARFDEPRKMLTTTLPCFVTYAGNGKWTDGEVAEVHRTLWATGQRYRDEFIARFVHGEPPVNFSDDQIFNDAIIYLQANYCVGPDELSLMQSFQRNDSTIKAAVMVANDFLTIAAWNEQLKKSDSPATAEDTNTSSGETV